MQPPIYPSSREEYQDADVDRKVEAVERRFRVPPCWIRREPSRSPRRAAPEPSFDRGEGNGETEYDEFTVPRTASERVFYAVRAFAIRGYGEK